MTLAFCPTHLHRRPRARALACCGSTRAVPDISVETYREATAPRMRCHRHRKSDDACKMVHVSHLREMSPRLISTVAASRGTWFRGADGVDAMGVSGQEAEAVRQGQSEARQPLYLAVYGSLRNEIQFGTWGRSAPRCRRKRSCRTASRSAVSTTRHALRLLEADGYIREGASVPGVFGCHGRSSAPQRRLVHGIHGRHRRDGRRRSLDIRSWKQERSAPDARDFGLPLSPDAPPLPARNPFAQRTTLCPLDHLLPARGRVTTVPRRLQ